MSGNLPLLVRWLTTAGVVPKAAVAQLESRQAPRTQSVLDAGRLAERTYSALDALGRDVVLLARMGQNLHQFGLKYSHTGLAVRNLRAGDWGVVHLLTKEDSNRSGIYCEGLANFFCDNPYEMACLIQSVPRSVEAALQANWRALARQVHCRNYSLTSYPWSLTTQNSNQWVLELLALASSADASNRAEAQAWLKHQAYAPSELAISLPTQWAGPLLRDSISFTDQPEAPRRQGQVTTVTVDSILKFLATAPVYATHQEELISVEVLL